MKTLLRSTFRSEQTEDLDLLMRNAQALRSAGLSFDISEDEAIWTWIQGFIDQYHHVPDASSIRGHFTSVNQMTIVDRMDSLAVERSRSQGDYLLLLEARVEDRRLRLTSEILREAGTIAVTGVTIKGGKGEPETHLKGPIAALRYVVDRAVEVVTPTTGQRLSGDVTADGDTALTTYERMENDPLAGLGQLTGIQQLDMALKGSHRKELWTHAAYTGGLKSTFALNWHYNQAVFYRHSSVLFSLEMPYEQCRTILGAIHSIHPKFDADRKNFGIKKSLVYEKIRDGELTKEQKEFYKIVLRDWSLPENQYGRLHIEVPDPDKTDFNINDLRSKSELLYQKDPAIRMVTIDHAGLMQSRSKYSNTTERLNEVLRDSKRFAMSFNRGMGIAVNALFQISREGYKAAGKNGGAYALHHLSYANEAERSSDVVTATWIDAELRESNMVKFQCLKTRDCAPFPPFYAGVNWPCRRVFTTHDVTSAVAKRTGEEIDLGL